MTRIFEKWPVQSIIKLVGSLTESTYLPTICYTYSVLENKALPSFDYIYGANYTE
jgi:hypothetical protein